MGQLPFAIPAVRLRHTAAALLAGTILSAAPAIAQTTPAQAGTQTAPTQAAADATPDSKDIVVTAQRRRESVQTVAIAVTALSGDALNDKAVVRQSDLQNASPGLSITKAGLTDSINIRGIGLASGSPQVTNGVSTYLDGVFQPPIVSGAQFYDMAGVEVLRGPQGTLSGANSTGGAIYMNTAKPTLDKFSAAGTIGYGNYNNVNANVAINLPLTDTLAVRFAGLANTRDSYYTDIGPAHSTPDRLSEHDARVQALWKSGKFQALGKVELIDRNTGGYAYRPIATTQFSADRAATATPWTVDYDTNPSNFERATMTNLEMKYQFDSGLTVLSRTAYLNKRINNVYDVDGTSLSSGTGVDGSSLAQLGQYQYVREREYSQEINLISPDSGAFKYVVGAYGQRNKVNVRLVNTTNGATSLYIEPDTDKLLLGVFGQASYQLNDKFQLEAGLRYSHFHVDGTGGVYSPARTLLVPQTGTEGDGRATGKITLNYKPDSNNLIYVFVARGYKNGGINPPGGTFAPETVMDYEAGWKSTFLDRHIRTQIGAFYNDYKNFQEDIINQTSGSSGVTNLASATIKGFEASFQGHVGGFSLDGGLSFVDSSLSSFSLINKWLVPSQYSGYPQCTGSNAARCYNYTPDITTSSGGPNLFSPKWTWNLGAQYKIEAGHDITVTPRVNYAYVGSQWAYVTYAAATDLINAHGLVNASVALDTKLNGNDLRLEFYGTNLANSFYVAGQSGKNEFYGAPREYGVRFSVKL
jgi:iron complex outermembrane recepter protein